MVVSQEKGWWAGWWLSAGLFGLILTVTFIAVVLYLGGSGPEGGPPQEVRRVSPKLVIPLGGLPPPGEEPYRVPALDSNPLHTRPIQETLEEIFSSATSKESSTKKKSEAVFPGWTGREPAVVDPKNHFGEDPGFRLPGFDPDGSPSGVPSEPRLEEAEPGERDVRNDLASSGSESSGWLDLLSSANESLARGNASVFLAKLKDMYYEEATSDAPVSSLVYPSGGAAGGTEGLLSFGLLAVDLFLLHNVQQIAWSEEKPLGERMLLDPEVLAMNALFLPPEKIRQMRNGRSGFPERGPPKTLLREVLDFFDGAVSALNNLGRAYMAASATGTAARGRGATDPTPLDCLWTLYCRNLDKTAHLDGPYGFLAKMNGLGLRLMMGEFPIEKAMEMLMSEIRRGWTPLNCSKLFPRCSAERAKEVVMATALGGNAL